MKTRHLYRWRVIFGGKPWVTGHLTKESAERDYGNYCTPEPVEGSHITEEVPVTEQEFIDAFMRTPTGHSTPRCHHCRGERWVCVDHLQPWPHEGCDAEGKACICNPDAAVAWREVYADNTPKGTPQ
jgi:hypothetical protein